MLILIVDDHELIRKGLVQALQGAGHNIVGEAATLAEARAELLFTKPDLVIVDVNLPDGSGLELITPRLPLSPKIALTSLNANSM
jgi:DNA-binding NarL/FixJ family response regulator